TIVIKKTAPLSINGALAFPGSQADVNVSSAVIDGRDTRIADQPGVPTGTATPVYGAAVNGGLPALAARLETALTGAPNEIRGKARTDPSATTRGSNTIRADSALMSQAVTDFINAAKSMADVTINASPGNRSSLSNVGSSCSLDVDSSTCWGTTTHPKIVYVPGAQSDLALRYT